MILPLLLRPHRPPGCLLVGVMGFVGEHPVFGTAGALAFLAANLLNAGALGRHEPPLQRFDFIEQQSAREKTVESLLAGGLTFDLQPGGTMEQHHAGGGLIDILSAVTAGPDKGLFNVGFPHIQRRHALRELSFLFRTNGE